MASRLTGGIDRPRPDHAIAGYRPEIDGLRAVAVIAVIIFHVDEALLPFGFLGVDVFFVISGFVITRSLAATEDWPVGERLRWFFKRRVKRLLPALLVCLAVTAIAAAMVIPNPAAYLKTGMYAVFGFSNFSLLLEAKAYFGAEGRLDPFIQTWSLGVEEQFYLLLAGLIFLQGVWRIALGPILVALFGLSVLLFLTLETVDPPSAFYLMPARLWELAAGVLLARLPPDLIRRYAAIRYAAGLSFAAVLIVLCFPAGTRSWLTIAVVAATVSVIAAVHRDTLAFRLLASTPMAATGRISYSLYLWHWSVLAIGQWTVGITAVTMPFLAALIVGLSLASYHLIERPLRHARWSGTDGRTLLISFGVACGCLIFFAGLRGPLQGSLLIRDVAATPVRPIYSQLDCHLPASATPIEDCLGRRNDKPHLFVMGDSHAGNLVPSLNVAAAAAGYEVRYLSDRALVIDMFGGYGCGGTACVADEREARLRFLTSEMRSNDVLIFSMARDRLYDRDFDGSPRRTDVRSDHLSSLKAALADMLRRMQRLDVPLVLVDDIPKLCSRSSFTIAKAVGRLEDCAVPRDVSLEDREPLSQLYRELEAMGALYLDPHDVLCEPGHCSSVREGSPIYADASPHFTQAAPAPLTAFFAAWLRAAIADRR